MDFVGDDRAQSVQVGAVLLFAVLIIAFSSYQAFAVPNQNREVEFGHSQAVQAQMQELRNAIVSTPGETGSRAVSIPLGTRYPSRLLGLNPGPPTGLLRTNGTADPDHNVTIRHAEADGETGDYWNGTTPRRYNTGTIVYSPNYNVYTEAPETYYEHSVVYNAFPSGDLALSGQTVVDGKDITLVALNGSLGRSSSSSTTVDVRPVSQSSTTVAVTNDDPTTNVSVSFRSRLSGDQWNETLADEMNQGGGDSRHVTDVSVTDGPGPFNTVTITFERDTTYRLRLVKAGVGTQVSETDATYLTNVTENGTTVAEGETTDIVVEARDSYNNPVTGVRVNASNVVSMPATTNEAGRATFTFDATGLDAGTYYVKTSLRAIDGGYAANGPENVTVAVVVEERATGGGGGSGPGYDVQWRDPSTYPGSATNPAASCSQIPCDPLPVRATTDPSGGGRLVTFYSNDSAVASSSAQFRVTGSAGTANTTLAAGGVGTADVVASNTNDGDTLQVETVLDSRFESGAGEWETFGTFRDTETGTTTDFQNRGSQSYRIDGGDAGGIQTMNGYDTADTDLLLVEYWVQEEGPEGNEDGGEDLEVQYLDADGNWQTVDRLEADNGGSGDGTGTYERRARIAANDAMHDDFRLRFRQRTADAPSDEWHVDDVHLTAIGTVTTGSGGGSGSGGSGSGSTPTLRTRVDDLTIQDTDSPRLIASYDVSNTNASFERVAVSFTNRDRPGASSSQQQSTARGGVVYNNGYGVADTYDVMFEVVYDIDGSERVVTSETITDDTDARNPTGNADLATASSAQLASWRIEDRSNSGQGPRYNFDYQLSDGSFTEAQYGVLNLPNDAASERRTTNSRSLSGKVVRPGGGGYQSPHRLFVVIRDTNGTVVDTVSREDDADGDETYTGP